MNAKETEPTTVTSEMEIQNRNLQKILIVITEQSEGGRQTADVTGHKCKRTRFEQTA